MARLASFDIGDGPIFTATFKDRHGNLADPGSVVFKFRDADAIEISYAYESSVLVTRVSTGVYEFTPPRLAINGIHFCRVVGLGGLAAADEDSINVVESAFETPL